MENTFWYNEYFVSDSEYGEKKKLRNVADEKKWRERKKLGGEYFGWKWSYYLKRIQKRGRSYTTCCFKAKTNCVHSRTFVEPVFVAICQSNGALLAWLKSY